TSSPSATACSARFATSWRQESAARATRRLRNGSRAQPGLRRSRAGAASPAPSPLPPTALERRRLAGGPGLQLLHAPAQAEEVIQTREHRDGDGHVEQRE